jgi:hypothetical protein
MLRPLILVASVAFYGACHAYVEPQPVVGTVEVTAAPVPIDVQTFPHTFYGGRTVFWIRNRWYFQDGGRWFVYREEPRPLMQFRQRGYVQEAPPAPRNEPPPSAPPAVRVQ